jgi:hypothetical protein
MNELRNVERWKDLSRRVEWRRGLIESIKMSRPASKVMVKLSRNSHSCERAKFHTAIRAV